MLTGPSDRPFPRWCCAELVNPAVCLELFGSRTVTSRSATSGWRGRSLSLGIADAVTVLAKSAANADVAATLIANEVNVDFPGIEKRPASELKDESDLEIGELRLLEVDNRLVLPIQKHIRVIVTAADVLHC